MYCGRCGKPMEDNLRFCPSCSYDMKIPRKMTKAEKRYIARPEKLYKAESANKDGKLKRLLKKLSGK